MFDIIIVVVVIRPSTSTPGFPARRTNIIRSFVIRSRRIVADTVGLGPTICSPGTVPYSVLMHCLERLTYPQKQAHQSALREFGMIDQIGVDHIL